jgi:hypothetical protein
MLLAGVLPKSLYERGSMSAPVRTDRSEALPRNDPIGQGQPSCQLSGVDQLPLSAAIGTSEIGSLICVADSAPARPGAVVCEIDGQFNSVALPRRVGLLEPG